MIKSRLLCESKKHEVKNSNHEVYCVPSCET